MAWKFESKFNKDTNQYEKNFEVAFATPIREVTTNGSVFYATADVSTAAQLAANAGNGYNGAIPTKCYSQKFLIHCWQFPDPWDRKQYVPSSVNVNLEVTMPTVKIPFDTIEFTPKIDIDRILLLLKPFDDLTAPYKLNSINIYMYLFIGQDPIITCRYGLRSECNNDYILESSVSEEWHDNRENDVDCMKRTITARYDGSNYVGGEDTHVIRRLNDVEGRIREADKIRSKYPELSVWYKSFMKQVETDMAKKYPDKIKLNKEAAKCAISKNLKECDTEEIKEEE